MNSNSKKRQRGENWLEEDKIILKDLVKERVRVIENKNTDTNSNTQKVAAWSGLKESFNCICKGPPRSVTQLKAQWGLIKIKEKKKKTELIDSNEFDLDNIKQEKLHPATCDKLNDMDDFGTENQMNDVQEIC